MSDDGSEDSPPRPKRKIKRVVVMSSNSSSDSDESIAPTGTRRKRMRVISDVESESSGSSVVCAGTRRKRTLPKLRDSEGDSDSSGWATDHSDAPKLAPASVKPVSGFASDSSEGNSDKCSICLMRFTTQEVGTPQNCEHIFCLDCITEWSKNVNTCPVDRLTFDSIVVRASAGGRVVRTDPVKVVERRPSVDMLVVEDPTVCEICGSSENEETMLLCDGCDLGFHMQCLTPPLTEIPADQWLCPNCDNILDVIHLSEVEDLFSGLVDIDLPLLPRPTPLREPRNVRRSSRNINPDEPSTSSGRRGGSLSADAAPSTSRGTRTGRRNGSSTGTTRRRVAGAPKRKYKRRRTKTVIIEYEVEENGKFPITKRVKRKVTKRRTKKRQPRTAARRSHVRASVRAKLAAHSAEPREERREARAGGGGRGGGALALALSRRRAGIPALSLFGDRHQLDYFDEDDERASEAATTAVAVRPSANIFSAYRQARRKMVTIPSPPHASSAPDLLSSILDSQTKLHSKNSVVSISVDGSVDIKLQTRSRGRPLGGAAGGERLDLTKGEEEATRKAPSYPGQSRGGGWGGGYRGGYPRAHGTGFNAGGYQPDGGQQPGRYAARAGPQGAGGMRRDDADGYGAFPRRQYPYPQNDDSFERTRRPPLADGSRPQDFPPNRRADDQRPARHSLGPSWQPYGAGAPGPRRDPPARHSLGPSDNPLDMRTGQTVPTNPQNSHPVSDEPRPYRPLPEPPVFKFDKTPDVDKSEDERSDSGLVIDTEKYDPTEPTHDDDSGDEAPRVAADVARGVLAGLEARARVPAAVLDSAVRQVLREHRGLLAPAPAAPAPAPPDRSDDDDDDGDCPNFSIYSAASVHIANDAGASAAPPAPAPDDMADLVQEDDDPPPPPPPLPLREPDVGRVKTYGYDATVKKKTEEELKEKVSKRCPITTNPRNPIKIKLNTPSLIKRHVPLYDEEEPADDAEAAARPDSGEEEEPPKKNLNDKGRSTDNGDDATDDPEVHKIQPSMDDKTDDEKDSSEDIEERTASPVERESVHESAPGPTDISKSKNGSDGEDEDKEGEKSPRITITEEASDEEKHEDDDREPEKRDDSSASEKDENQDDDAANDDVSDEEFPPHSRDSTDKHDDGIEKMTESISETEDERSYTPCLDENKSKDTSLETEKEKGIEGLDTEMISEDEGNEMFSDEERARSPSPAPPAAAPEDGEILDKRKDKPDRDDAAKKKKRKDSKRDSKKEGKDKSKKAKKAEVAFKKLSKSGKERNYRDRDKDKDKEDRPRRDSSAERKRKRKEKRKDLERYDVRTVVTVKRRRVKDPFGRDVSPRRSRSPSPSLERSPPARASPSPPRKRSRSRSRSRSRGRRSPSPSPPARRTPSPAPAAASPRRRRRSGERARRRASGERGRKRRASGSASPARGKSKGKRRRRARSERPTRRRSPKRRRARRRSRSRSAARDPPAPLPPADWSPVWGAGAAGATGAAGAEGAGAGGASPGGSVDSRLLSPRTPPPRRRHERRRRARSTAAASKEVFTSGDNILVSVSFKEQERGRDDSSPARRSRRSRRRRAPAAEPAAPRPVAIIDLERSPFRELTPSPRNVIVLSDSDHGGNEGAPKEKPTEAAPPAGPRTPRRDPPPDADAPHAPHDAHAAHAAHAADKGHGAGAGAGAAAGAEAAAAAGGAAPRSPDAYDPFEPTRSASGSRSASRSPPAAALTPPRPSITLEAAQKTNLSADDVIDRRPLSPMEKVMALLQSTRDVSPEPPPTDVSNPPLASPPPLGGAGAGAAPPAAPRIVLPDAPRSAPPKLFLAKPSPIKSDPIKPMQARPVRRAESEAGAGGDSPYSPGSSDFGDLFEPPAPPRALRRDAFDSLVDKHARPRKSAAAKVPVKLNKKKGKTQVGVKIDEDNLKILDDLPSSAVEMQVKSKFLKKLNRQERVVEEVKLVLKPHYNKKRVTKDEYKDILRRAVPKICHNKSGEINPTKIQALVEAYVKKFRKKHKLGLA